MTLAALVLAAGAGRRFGGGKLSAPFLGEPLIAHALRAACAAPVAKVVVVASPDLALVDQAKNVEVLRIASAELSASLKAGVAAAGDVDGLFVFLGDMPLVPLAIAGELAGALGNSYAALPRCGGVNGHPVLLSRRALADVAHLHGDEGMGRLLKPRSDIAFVETSDKGVLLDIDRAEDLTRLEKLRGA